MSIFDLNLSKLLQAGYLWLRMPDPYSWTHDTSPGIQIPGNQIRALDFFLNYPVALDQCYEFAWVKHIYKFRGVMGEAPPLSKFSFTPTLPSWFKARLMYGSTTGKDLCYKSPSLQYGSFVYKEYAMQHTWPQIFLWRVLINWQNICGKLKMPILIWNLIIETPRLRVGLVGL